MEVNQLSTCFMKIATFFLHSRQSSLQLVLSILKDYFVEESLLNRLLIIVNLLLKQLIDLYIGRQRTKIFANSTFPTQSQASAVIYQFYCLQFNQQLMRIYQVNWLILFYFICTALQKNYLEFDRSFIIITLDNYSIKMNEEKMFNGLTDFSNLRKKTQDYNSDRSKVSTMNFAGDLDIESNEKIIKSFRELRQKLKAANKENQNLREEMSSLQIEVKQLHQSQNNLLAINHQFKDKSSQMQHINDDLMKKIALMKESLSEKPKLEGELIFLKENLVEVKVKAERLEEEKKRLIEISIEDKIALEQRVNRLELKGKSDEKYLTEIQTELSRSKENGLKLQNQLRKIEIKYDEEGFNQKWSKDNFEKEHYIKQIKQLEGEVVELKAKIRKQKQKRVDLQQRVLQLQQISGLWTVKAEAFEGEADIMSKKVKKMERRMSVAKSSANKLANERITWEQKFSKCVLISEELINRVKRELLGDLVELAKSCEFKINKLKDGDFLKQSNAREGHSSGKRNRTDRKHKKSVQKQQTAGKNELRKKLFMEEEADNKLKQTIVNQKLGSENISQRYKQIQYKTNVDVLANKQNEYGSQLINIDNKIKRQREEMQKKLKERMLYRKIEVSSSPDKNKLRDDYLQHIFMK